ncbi:hypothetical protein QA639_13460 [Bradyrhizobium pachyrhizi]|uniref:hypothetical protein n=1 Tax=Bradyrhizobium pachyrhizi TaxID=280333 RepID=UPI0024B1C7F7|nr:hypothetical protein [Bradyrhizobium pachyrhizi]WFU58437.1 hypothetical protein QA639_13460 [Bradyrhizobium pachyrhizi]
MALHWGSIVLAPIRLLAGYMASHFPTLMDINLPMPMRRSSGCRFRGRGFQFTQIELTGIRWFRRGAEVICSSVSAGLAVDALAQIVRTRTHEDVARHSLLQFVLRSTTIRILRISPFPPHCA